jgi:hypothetical protein
MGLIHRKWKKKKILVLSLLLPILFLYYDNIKSPENQFLAKIAVGSINFYQENISHNVFFIKCRYKVTCSEYTKRAIIKTGFFQGLSKGWNRATSCF